MTFVTDQQLGSVNYTTPKAIIIEITPNPTARAASTNVAGIVAQFNRGNTNRTYTVGSMTDVGKKLGVYVNGLDGYYFMKNFYDANGGTAKVAIAASSGRTSASGYIRATHATSGTILGIFVADSSGTWGNSLLIDVKEASVADYFNITVRNPNTTESRTYQKVTTDSSDARYIKTIIDADANRFFSYTSVVTDGTVALADTTFTFSGGLNGTVEGSSVADTAYVGTDSGGLRSGIQLFKNQAESDVIVVGSARNTSTINAALLTHVADITLQPRRTIVPFAVGTTVDQAITAVASLDTDKAKVVFPYVKVFNIFTNQEETFNPTAFELANDTLMSYHLSASQTRLPDTVTALELELSSTEIDSLTAKRINPYALEAGRGFIRKSDYTLSSNPALAQNVVRKAKDFFGRSFYTSIQPYLSKPINQRLFDNLKDTLSSLLRIEERAERIGNLYGAAFGVKCDNDNNPPESVDQNRVNILVEISLLAPADFIQVFMDARQNKTVNI